MCQKNSVSAEKPFSLYLQNTLISLGLYLIAVIKGSSNFSVKSFGFRFLPGSWFLVIYIAMFLLIPFINLAIMQLSDKAFKVLLGVSIFCFSLWATGVDIIESLLSTIQTNGGGLVGYSPIGQRGSQGGYTIVNFIMMYYLGAYIRKTDLTLKSKICFPLVLLNTLLIFLWINFDYSVGEEYCNPLVILNAVLIFLLFKNIKIHSRIINRIAAASFTVYIFHIALLFKLPKDLCYGNKALALPKLFLIVCGIYFVCWIVWEIYNNTVNKLLAKVLFEKYNLNIVNGIEDKEV